MLFPLRFAPLSLFIAASFCLLLFRTQAEATDETRYTLLAETLLREAIARETAYGLGEVPDYANSLRTRFLELLSSLPVSASTEVTVVLDVIGANKSPQCEHT